MDLLAQHTEGAVRAIESGDFGTDPEHGSPGSKIAAASGALDSAEAA